MDKPTVSVILPNYCHSVFLDERIISILNQSYNNFELIILDDCSPDEGASRRVIEKYQNDPHISHVIFNDTNSGSTFKQWDLGLRLAKGELIWIAESDDACSPLLLESLVSEFSKYPNTVMAYTTSCYYDVNGNISIIRRNRRDEHYKGKDFIKKYMLHGNSVRNASSCVFLKDVAMSISREFSKYKGAGDRLFWIFIAERGGVSVVNKGLNYFRQHGTNTTSKYYSNGVNFIEDKQIFDYLNDNAYSNYAANCYAKWFENKMIKKTDFITEEISNQVADLWKISPIEEIIAHMYNWCRIYISGINRFLDIILDRCCQHN